MLFRQFLRIVFVLFSLYLLGDAFYRWDGFSYYASFSEFLPAVALTSIIWSLIGILTAIFLWLVLKLTEWSFQRGGLKIRIEYLILYAVIFVLLGSSVWKVKKLIWSDVQTTPQFKIAVFISIAVISGLLMVLFRNKAEQWVSVVQERIEPLVWLFGAFVILSVPLVTYYTWVRGTDKAILHELVKPHVKDKNHPNIILVTFDALAAQEMPTYGYHRETTPFISEWAKKATVFTKVEAGSNFTTSAAAGLMTGKRVWTHQIYQIEGSPVRGDNENMPAVLKKHGYYNIAFVVNPHASVKKLGMSGSFDMAPSAAEFSVSRSLIGNKFGTVDAALCRLFGDKIRLYDWILQRDFIMNRFFNIISRNFDQTEVPPEKAFKRFREILDNNLPEPYFAWIHVLPPHDPYLPPGAYIGPSSELRDYRKQANLLDESYKYLFQYHPFPQEMQPAVNIMRDYYDEFIKYIDKEFGNFVEELNKRQHDNTVVILSADHGESFEHGYFTHGGLFLYEQVTHIPLIIKRPGRHEGQIVDALVEQIDVPATILDLTNIEIPSWMDGRSLIPLMRGERLPNRPAFSMNFEGNRSRGRQIVSGSIAVWEDDYKLIHYLGKNKSLLFNLKQDPDEMNNLYDKETETGLHLLGLIQDNLKKANEKIIIEKIGNADKNNQTG